MNDSSSGSRWEPTDASDRSETQPIAAAGESGSQGAPEQTDAQRAEAEDPTVAQPVAPPNTDDESEAHHEVAPGAAASESNSRGQGLRDRLASGRRWAGARKGLIAAALALVLLGGSAGFAMGHAAGDGRDGRGGFSPAGFREGGPGPGRHGDEGDGGGHLAPGAPVPPGYSDGDGANQDSSTDPGSDT